MKILIFNELYTPYSKGGAEKSTQLLAETLSKLGNEVHICTSSKKESNETINGVFVHRRKQHNVYWSFDKDNHASYAKILWHFLEIYNILVYKDIKKLISQIKPDIIHTNVFTGYSVIIWQIAKQQQIPVIHTLRDYYLMCIRSTLFNNDKNCLNRCSICKIASYSKRLLSQKVDAVVGISEFILNTHLQHSYFKNAFIKEIIPNSVSMPVIEGKIQRKNIIGFLGRIHPSKGIEILIENFLKVNPENYILQIAGNGNNAYINTLKSKYKNTKVQFIGKVQAEQFLRNIKLLVVPSLWQEPFGRVIIEANACECPVLVSNRGGMPELIDGSNGKVFDIEQKDSLSTLIQQFIEGKLTFSINQKFNKYDNAIIADRYLKLYKKLYSTYKKINI